MKHNEHNYFKMIEANEMQSALIDITIKNSGFDTKRDYISLSNIYKPVDEICKDYQDGYTANDRALLKCYKGYQMERDIVARLMSAYNGVPFLTNQEVFIGKHFKGHPDLVHAITRYPYDCKSVLMDDWMPKSYKEVSRKIKFQMQAYMIALGVKNSYLIYESRESGLIKVIEVRADYKIQSEIHYKILEIHKQLFNS